MYGIGQDGSTYLYAHVKYEVTDELKAQAATGIFGGESSTLIEWKPAAVPWCTYSRTVSMLAVNLSASLDRTSVHALFIL